VAVAVRNTGERVRVRQIADFRQLPEVLRLCNVSMELFLLVCSYRSYPQMVSGGGPELLLGRTNYNDGD
jgi:hypothetical protein